MERRGFTLIEVMLAVVILTTVLISVARYTGQFLHTVSTSTVRTVAAEVAPLGIHVNPVAPGYVDSPLVAALSRSELGKRLLAARPIPMGRLAKMSEIAATVVFLASHHADYFAGEVLTVGGGL